MANKHLPADEYIKTSCPACDVPIEFPVQGLGQWIDCPHCGRTIELKKSLPLKAALISRLFLNLQTRWSRCPNFNWKWVCVLTLSLFVIGAALWVYADFKATAIEQAAKLLEAQKQIAFEAQQAEISRQELLRLQVVVAEKARKDAELAASQQKQAADDLKAKLAEANRQAQLADWNRQQEALRQQQALEEANRQAQLAARNRQQALEDANRIAAQADWNRQQEALRQQRALEEASRQAQLAEWNRERAMNEANRIAAQAEWNRQQEVLQNQSPARRNGFIESNF